LRSKVNVSKNIIRNCQSRDTGRKRRKKQTKTRSNRIHIILPVIAIFIQTQFVSCWVW